MKSIIKTRKLAFSYILIFGVFFSGLAVFFINQQAASAIESEFLQAYKNMRTRLPDDKYDLYKRSSTGGNAYQVSSSEQCKNNPQYPGQTNGKWGCNSGLAEYFNEGDSQTIGGGHQYITLSNDDINDNIDPNQFGTYYSKTIKIGIYTTTPGPKDINLLVVNRGIGALACGNKLTAYYYTGSMTNPQPVGSPRAINSADCNNNETFEGQFPADAFQEIEENDVRTGIYRGQIVIKFNDNNPEKSQTSFIVYSSGARLGYLSQTPRLGAETCPYISYSVSCTAWASTYPTNYSSTNNLRFYFRPPCELAPGTGFFIGWQDANVGTNIQPNDPAARARVYKFKPDAILKDSNGDGQLDTSPEVIHVRDYNVLNSSIGTVGPVFRPESTDTYGPNQQYAWLVDFQNIRGGNGINFKHPYNSADARIPCKGPPPDAPPAAECEFYQHNFNRDDPARTSEPAFYRVRVFGRAIDHVISSPPENAVRSSQGAWKSLSSGPPPGKVYDRTITVGQFVDDGVVRYNPNAPIGNPTFTLTYPAPAGPDWKVYIEKWDHTTNHNNSADGSIDWQYRSFTVTETSCYSAACQIIVQSGEGLPANSVFGNSTFKVKIRLYNNGRDTLPVNTRGYGLSGTVPPSSSWAVGPHYSSSGVGPPSDRSNPETWPYVDISLPDQLAPGNISSLALRAYPDYYGLFILGAECPPVTVNTYMPFNITPYAAIDSMDSEDPRIITYSTGGTNSGADVTVNRWNGKLIQKRGGAEISTLHTTYDGPYLFGDPNLQRSYGSAGTSLVPGTLQTGDEVCAYSYVTPTDGWVGPGGDIRLESTRGIPEGNPLEACRTIEDRPYVRAYGADMIAGSGTTTNGLCSPGAPANSRIWGYNSTQPDRGGSGAQFAALALGAIQEFTTASLRSTVPISPNGLSIANNPVLGFYTGEAICSTDFFNDKKIPDPDNPKRDDSIASDLDFVTLTDGRQTVFNDKDLPGYAANYRLDINGTGATPFNKRHTVFVDGNVVIKNNIVLSDFGDPLSAPAFALIVSGNIYIQGNVDRLDGMYVAQKRPTDNTGGTIYTCTNDNVPYDPSGNDAAMLAACTTPLKVNGIFSANEVKLLRTIYSLRDSLKREHTDTPCPQPRSAGNLNSCAAELFNFTPEIFLSPPPFYDEPPSVDFQSYETLPPIL